MLPNRVQLIYSSHPKWPLPPSLPISAPRPLRVSVLDSSYNPPTLAHLALANSTHPDASDDYDARLLLLSVRNADKSLKPGDATYLQRLDMMRLLSNHITNTPNNVAVAVIDEPTFVGKSTQLLSFLKQRFIDMSDVHNIHRPSVQLAFVMGLDTLDRFFAPRYYGSAGQMQLALRNFFSPPPEGEDSYVVCARRIQGDLEAELSNIHHGQEFIDSGRVIMIDIGTKESTYSSTAIRSNIKLGVSSWRSCVTDSIAQYIVQNRLYQCT